MHEHAPRVRPVNTSEDLAEGTLAGPVLTTERVARALGNVERYAVERLDADEALRDLVESDGECLGHFIDKYLGSTSVKPHAFNCRAQSPRFAFVTRTSSIGMICGTSFLKCTLSTIVFTPS